MINIEDIFERVLTANETQSGDLVVVLGPTASGKTRLAVQIAKACDGEIISADSRQVYTGMDIGTGKDILEYEGVKYHLIDILQPGEKYNISRFNSDFARAYQEIRSRGKRVIVCGGTGFYLESLLTPKPYAQVPVDENLRGELSFFDKEQLRIRLSEMQIPIDFDIDFSSKKRIIRAIEIVSWLASNPEALLLPQVVYPALIIGLNPETTIRRESITKRLKERLNAGMIQEVEQLLLSGISHKELEYYGLEYKYISYYLQGKMTYQDFFDKLETQIHRYAKRQMTFFRKMEKDGIVISWIKNN